MRYRAAKNISGNESIRKLDSLEIDVRGICGEYACSKILNICPYSIFCVRPSWDKSYVDNGDLLYSGLNLDVKSVTSDAHKLKVPQRLKNGSIDIFVLMHGQDKFWELLGAIPASDVFNRSRYDRQHRCYNVSPSELWTIDECVAYCEALKV